jgi:oxygen-independent coproporphyrinogen-3 oxidase
MPTLSVLPPAPATPAATVTPAALPAVTVPALYVHIPFCFHKCHYCDFYSITRQGEDRMARFVDLMLAEADLWAAARPGPTPVPRTVFFGGGTPSLLPPPLMRRLIEGLHARFDLMQVDEWTCECNPATVAGDDAATKAGGAEAYGHDYLAMLHELGVNRLSFGAQSFHADDLAALERHHDPADVPASVAIARAVGFDRLNVDLMYAVPGQTPARWEHNLEQALALGTEHLSCYGLTYEPNTPMAVKKRLGTVRPTDEDVELTMFHHTRDRLNAAGLPAYEVSNYARPGAACRHNLAYWHGDDYVALGPSGASHVQGNRWKNRPHLGEWERAIADGRLPAADVEHLTPAQRAGELAMLRLRLADGIDYADFTARTGRDARDLFADALGRFEAVGLLASDAAGVRLTEKGWDVADAVAGEMLVDE